MIRIGNQTSCWAATPFEPFDYALAQGFDAFEWFPDKKPDAGWDASDLDASARERLRELAHANKVRVSVHARWQEDLLAAESYPLVLEDLELARDLGAVLLNIHLAHEQGLAAFVEAIAPLIRRTAEAGLQLSIENTPQHSPEQFNELFGRLYRMKSTETKHVGMCLDLGHANLCAATRNDYLGFVDRLDSQVPLIHLHLHENWGDADTHLPLFTGPSARDDAGIRGLLTRLRRRHYSGSVILEQWPHPPSLLNHARDRLLEMWKAGASRAKVGRVVLSAPPQPAGDLTAELVAGDRRHRSWREKLEFVRQLLAREQPPLTADDLVDVAIYLRFLGTGELACSEDGRHFRPAHHARLASQIQERLSRLTTPDTVFIVRKIYPWLPSSAPDFQRPEPLTRIRDIAHRNDIDPDLKREIKTTLQNKLHRCAGPEDLVTSAALLKRITAPGATHSPAFVEQFKIFHEELKEFFNARSLDERLAALSASVDGRQAELLQLFGQQKKTTGGLTGQLAALKTLTSLREVFLDALQRTPVPGNHEFLLADIALEDFAFVLLSEIINALEAAEPASGWEPWMEALTLALTNLALSGVAPAEVGAVEAELQAWGRISAPANRDELLRLKATIQRCRRLAEEFGERTIALFAGRAEKLGQALGVAQHALRVFAEADIRAHNVFQVSKLAAGCLRQLRERLGLPAWDVLVSGRATGEVRVAESLDDLVAGQGGRLLVLLRRAAGDEEIPKKVAGIVVAHEVPHLSHLGVRARQAGVVFAACEEAREFERLRQFEGKRICFAALPEQVSWELAGEEEPPANPPARTSPRIFAARTHPASPWVSLEEAVLETAGGKAAGARRLAELSRLDGAGFSTPPALVVPIGVMEAQLDAAPALAEQYRRVVSQLDGLPAADFTAATQRLQEVVRELAVPEAIVAEAKRRFSPGGRLMVRSSASCEDLEGASGAGLYDSVMNVPPGEVAAAVRTVWSSLWTRRAALSRLQAGITHEQARMAVLIQEMLVPDLSFVLHTVNPINHRAAEVYAEVVVGLGDTLAAAAARGNPYRMVCDKRTGATTMLAFANFSQASWPNPAGGVRRETVNYATIELSRDEGARQRLGKRLAAIGRFVEHALQQPQDIEGVAAGDRIYLVQARPQPGR